ncbi:MAG: flagellar filament capping protein FliD [Anaerolineae bacterium]|nr:flagellar filament capping protein FliD [Anaerolineae bacterium]
MVLSTSSSSSYNLDPTWMNLIELTLKAERQQRLERYTQERDNLDVRKSIFTDLKTALEGLDSAASSLKESMASYAASGIARTATVSGAPSGATVLTASATASASPGTYTIDFSYSGASLAKAHSVQSDQQTGSDVALGLTGTIEINSKVISVTNTDTLYTLSSKINSAGFASGQEVTASVIDRRLVLTANYTGTAYALALSQTGGVLDSLGIFSSGSLKADNVLSEAADAKFKLNGVEVTRSKNSITDLISGVTLNLASDAVGKTATLTISDDVTSLRKSIEDFVVKFNELQNYLALKTGSKKVDDKKYERGALADDFSIRGLRRELADLAGFSTSSGAFRNFEALGISLDNDLMLKITDVSKLNTALTSNFNDVKTFLDVKLTGFKNLMNGYIGTSGYVTYSMNSFDERRSALSRQIESEETRLAAREQQLLDYYYTLDEQMNTLLYQQKTLGTTLSAFSNIYNYLA